MVGEVSRRARSSACLVLLLALVPLMACSGPTLPVYPSFQAEARRPVHSDAEGAPLRMARATRQAGDLGAAIQIYRTAAASRSVTPETLVEFGDVQLEAGFPDDAIDAYSKVGSAPAVRVAARLGALLGLMRATVILGQPAEALAYADAAQALAPDDPRVQINRGVALDSLGRHAEAQTCYRSVLRITPRDVPARNNLALSLALVKRFDEAIALIAPLVRSSAATPRVRENMALIYALMGDQTQAAALSRIDLDEDATLSNLAFLEAVRGQTP